MELVLLCQDIRKIHPEIDHLFVSNTGRWLFCADTTPVEFDGSENIEELVSAIGNLKQVPCAIYLGE